MFSYDKFLQYPIKIKNKNPQLASLIATQYGGAYTVNYEIYRKKTASLAASRATKAVFIFIKFTKHI